MTDREYFRAGSLRDTERARLSALEAAKDPDTFRRLAECGIAAGSRCLEVGGGGGSVAEWMADRVGPSGQVVAVDIDTRFIDAIARGNVAARRHDILSGPVDAGSFDLVHCRLLLIHLTDPVRAIANMVASLRPGGLMLIEEADFSTYRAVDPSHPGSAEFSRLVRTLFDRVRDRNVFDPYYGPRIHALLEQAGLGDVQTEGAVHLRRGGDAEATEHLLSLSTFEASGVLSAAEVQTLAAALGDPAFRFVGHTIFAARGRAS